MILLMALSLLCRYIDIYTHICLYKYVYRYLSIYIHTHTHTIVACDQKKKKFFNEHYCICNNKMYVAKCNLGQKLPRQNESNESN